MNNRSNIPDGGEVIVPESILPEGENEGIKGGVRGVVIGRGFYEDTTCICFRTEMGTAHTREFPSHALKPASRQAG